MSTTFANSIDNNLIYADRAEHDAAGNDLQTTYATKAELPEFSQAEQDAMDSGITSTKVSNYNNHLADTDIHVTTSDKSTWNGKQDAINDLSTIRSGAQAGSTAVQPGDLSAVAVSGDYNDLLDKPTIKPIVAGTNITITEGVNNVTIAATAQAAPVQDVEVNGSSVVNAQGVAEITLPSFTQAQADWTEADTADPSYIQNKPTVKPVVAGSNITITEGNDNVTIAATVPNVPVTDVEVDGTSVVNTQGVAEITMPTFTQAQADWTEADTTDPSYIQNKPTLAAVATSGAYADLSGTPTINNVPAVTSSDDNKVLKASYSGGVGSYSWEAESGGTVTDVEVDGTSVVSGGVASITMPTELVPAVGSGDNAKVLTAEYDSDTGTGSYSWKVPAGLFIAQYGTSTYNEVDAAARAGKIVYCYVNGRFAFLAYTNAAGADYNYEFQYYRSAASGKDSVFIYKVRPAGSIYGPEWETTQRDVKAGNISYPVTNVKVNGSSVMSGTVAEITLPTIPVTDVEVDGTSVVNASGVASITMPTELVPAVTSSDNNKVLKASYSGGVGSYSWQTESGGGGGGGSYTAGTGIDITNDVISVDTSVVATQTDLADKEDAFTVGTGLEMDTSGATPTLQVETPMDIVAGPGISIDNPDSDTLRVSVGTTFTQAQLNYLKAALGLDETVLYSGLKTNGDGGSATYNLSELPTNFQIIKVYCCASDNEFSASQTGNCGMAFFEWDTTMYTPPNTFLPVLMNGGSGTSFTQYWVSANVNGINTTTWTVQGSLNSATSNAKWFHIYKIVGIHRIANN